MPVSVAPDDPHSTHHISLVAEDGSQIGLILCDSTGKRLPYSIARSNLQSIPLKTSSGESQYSDLELPFVVSPQQDWSGGLGQDRFEDNVTKYARSLRVESIPQGLTLGPMEHYTEYLNDAAQTAPGLNPAAGYWPTERASDVGRLAFHSGVSPSFVAMQFTPLQDTDTDYIWLMFRNSEAGDAAGSTVNWEIQADLLGEPDGVTVDSGTFTNGVPFDYPAIQLRVQSNSSPVTLTGGTTYWFFVFPHVDADADSHGTLYYSFDGDDADGAHGDDGSTWTVDTDFRCIFRITEGDFDADSFAGWFFEYREQLYFATKPDAEPSTDSRLYMNGWRGAADANTGALDKLKDATQTGWGERAVGGVVKIIAGKGSEEETPYRYVTAAVSGELTVAQDWIIEHDITTEYVVLGVNYWEEITPTGADALANTVFHRPISAGATDTTKSGMIAYFTQHRDSAGAGPRIRAMREFNSAGTWTREWETYHILGGGEHGEFLITVEDETDGFVLYKAEQGYITGVGALAQRALLSHEWTDVDWTAFSADELIGHDKDEKIVNLVEYLNPDTEARIPWIITEGRLTARKEGEWRSVKLDELASFRSKFTGKVALVWNTFLFLSLAGGLLEQFSNGTLIDVGPGRGLNPFSELSLFSYEIEAGAVYPGRFFVAANQAEPSDFAPGQEFAARVFQTKGNGQWDCIYQGPGRGPLSPVNPRIRDLYVQSIPAATDGGAQGKVNRLWMLQGKDLVWLELPNQGQGPLTDPHYAMAIEGAVESSKIYAGLDDRNKVYSSMKVVSENLEGSFDDEVMSLGEAVVVADFEADSASDMVASFAWTPIPDAYFGVSPSQERFLTDYFTDDTVDTVRGRYLKYRLRLNRTLGAQASKPYIRAVLIESLLGLPVKYSFTNTVLFEDRQLDLQNHLDDFATAEAKLDALEAFADRPEVFTMRCIAPALHGAKVVTSAPEPQPVELAEAAAASEDGVTLEAYVGTLRFIQLVLGP